MMAVARLSRENYEPIENEFINELNENNIFKNKEAKWEQKNCTLFIKDTLCDIGMKYDLVSYAAGSEMKCKPAWGEYLYDFVLAKEEKVDKNTFIIRVDTVLESEFAYDYEHITEDFDKLLMSNSLRKIFICRRDERDEFKVLVDQLIERIKRYQLLNIGSRFLFVCYCHTGKCFLSDCYITV